MKYFFLICIILFCSCGYKEQKNNQEISEFIVDSTLKRNYQECKGCYFMPNNHNGKDVQTAKKAFELALPILSDMNKGNIENLIPIHITLVEDTIWILYGYPHPKDNEIIMGGGLYIEMSKNNGAILKAIIEE